MVIFVQQIIQWNMQIKLFLLLLIQASPTLRCDFCREYPYEKKIAVYSDRECNFDICKTCFIALSFDS